MEKLGKTNSIQIWSESGFEKLVAPLQQALEVPSKALAQLFAHYDSDPTTLLREMFDFVDAPLEESQRRYQHLADKWDKFRAQTAKGELAWDDGKGPYLLLSPARHKTFGLAAATLCSRCQTVQMTIMKRNVKFPAEKGAANRLVWFVEFSFDPFDGRFEDHYNGCLAILRKDIAPLPGITFAHN